MRLPLDSMKRTMPESLRSPAGASPRMLARSKSSCELRLGRKLFRTESWARTARTGRGWTRGSPPRHRRPWQGGFDAPHQSRAQEARLDDVEEARECRHGKGREEKHGYEEAYARFLANCHLSFAFAPFYNVSNKPGRAFYSISAPEMALYTANAA